MGNSDRGPTSAPPVMQSLLSEAQVQKPGTDGAEAVSCTEQTSLQLYKDPKLEARFCIYHNRVMTTVDVVWILFATLLLPVTIVGCLWQGREVYPVEWARFSLIPLTGYAVQWLAPKHWIRCREWYWCLHHIDVMCGTSLPASFVFRNAPDHVVMAYGFAGCLTNAVGHKVRFHLQMATSATNYCIALVMMASNKSMAIWQPSLVWMVAHFICVVALPCMLVFKWDKHMRKMFLQKTTRNGNAQAHG